MTSYQTTKASTHYNDALPIYFATTTSGSGSVKSGAPAPAPAPAAPAESATENRGEIEQSTETTAEEVLELVEKLLSLKSALPSRELNHYSSKLRTVVRSLPEAYLLALDNILRLVVSRFDKNSAKDELVRFMMLESGVASWGTGLRRIIDGCEVSIASPAESDSGVSRPPSESSWVEVSKDEWQ
ncbi:hypothetical protein V1517DRAFT_304964 [Lipomyces orientalis]|uniref:Uncharacterized protein n=1 Tax=Lipomyces orientalis TaxID=1233043 RepID=A0ACC3TYH9_9ASCO